MALKVPATPPRDPRQVPRPGQVFDPVGRALDRIGDRWTLVLIRHLLGGPKGFQDLRQRTGIAPRVLSARLRQLAERDWITTVEEGARSLYAVTERGRTLEPLVAAIARWWVDHAMEEHIAGFGAFTETSAQSILESLPFLLREDVARDAAVIFEIRLSGPGGGVWSLRIRDGACTVTRGFAETADVRYAAETRVWCGVALGILDARDAVKRGLLIKDGGRDALDQYFHQIPAADRDLLGAQRIGAKDQEKQMISFGPTEEQEVARDAMRDFAASAIRPIARRCDEESLVPDEFLAQAWQLGLVSTQIPEAFGGGGEPRSPITNALVLEELAFGDAGLALAAVAPALFAMPIVEFGTEAQQREFLPLFCGDAFHAASLALVEPGPCFDPSALRTSAERKDDRFVLSGAKCFVPLADRASHFLVLARNGGDGADAVQAFLVPRDAAGLTIASPEKNLGLRALATGTLTLERVEVPVSARLGGDAGCDARRIVNLARTAQAAVLVGVSRAVMEYAIPYAKDREAFDEAIAKKQAIAFTLADMCIEVDAMRWLTWQAASRLEQGLDATREAQLARIYCARQAMKIADDGVQVLGGHGFIREHPVELWYRNVRMLGVLDGAALV